MLRKLIPISFRVQKTTLEALEKHAKTLSEQRGKKVFVSDVCKELVETVFSPPDDELKAADAAFALMTPYERSQLD